MRGKRVHFRPDPTGKTLCDRAVIGQGHASSRADILFGEGEDKYSVRFTSNPDRVTCTSCRERMLKL